MAELGERKRLDWVVGHTEDPKHEPAELVPATVPGAVQLDWARAKGWGDPHYGENWREYRWMEDVYWVYRARVDLEAVEGQRLLFVCGGVDYRFEVRLGGELLLEQEGMFTPVELDLTPHRGRQQLLELVVFPVPKSRPTPEDRSQADACCKPAVSYVWDFHPRLIPSGIWRETFVEQRPELHIQRADLDYELSDDLTTARLSLEVETTTPGARLRWSLEDSGGSRVAAVDAEPSGRSATLRCTIDGVSLWWPHDHGTPHLYRSKVELLDDQGRAIDCVERRFGLRRARLVMHEGAWDEPRENEFPKPRSQPPITLEINGRRIFCKGSNWVCPDIFPGRVTADRYREQVAQARDAHMNLLRCWGGAVVPQEAFFEACDELGLMVWQEFPLCCNRYEGTPGYLAVLDQESRSIIRRLREHPSLVVWCGGNELFNAWSGMTDQDLALRLLNRNCYDLDPQRPYLPTSPVAGMAHGHYVFRSAAGEEVFQLFAKASSTAYTEFGCPGPAEISTLEATLPAAELFPPREGTSWQSHGAFGAWAHNSHLLLDVIEDYFGPSEDLESLVERGQLLQGEGLKCLYEEARRQKPKAAMALNWCFNEPWPAAANMSLLGWPSKPKPALLEVRAACRPVLASARIARFVWQEGDLFAPELWLLNDSASELAAARIEALLELDGGTIPLLRWDHPRVPPNRNLAGPTLRQLLPRAAAGRMRLRLCCPDQPDRDSSYTLLYRPRDRAVPTGTRALNK